MKRSSINRILHNADDMIRRHGFALPPFAYWTPDEFRNRADDACQVIDARRGWDITDYGKGDFDAMGLFLFTLRNSRLNDLHRGRGMCYAEKLLISRQDQLSPMHTPARRLIVIGAGRASARMAEAVEDAYGPCDGLVITRYGCARPTQGIRIVEAAHPVPDSAGIAATVEILDLVS